MKVIYAVNLLHTPNVTFDFHDQWLPSTQCEIRIEHYLQRGYATVSGRLSFQRDATPHCGDSKKKYW